MSQALRAAAFGVLRLLWAAGWLWLEFRHTDFKEKTVKPTPPKSNASQSFCKQTPFRQQAKKSILEDAVDPSYFTFFFRVVPGSSCSAWRASPPWQRNRPAPP